MGTYTNVLVHDNSIGSGGGPTMYGSGTVNISRNGNIINVNIDASIRLQIKSSATSFAFQYAVEVKWNNQVKGWFYVKTGYGRRGSSADLAKYPNATSSASYSCSWDDGNAGTVTIRYICCAWGNYTYQSNNCDEDVDVYSEYIGSAYTPSNIWLNPYDYTKIARVGVGPWSVHYSYSAGSNSNVPISLAIHDYGATSWGVRWEPVLRYINGSSDGVWDNYTLGFDRGFANRI